MPLMKRAPTTSNSQQESTEQTTDKIESIPARQQAITKDDYWRRREERDIETGLRIRRSGVIQAAAMSIGTSQYNTGSTIESYADVVEKLAERMLAWVNK